MIFIGMDVHVRNSFLHITDEGGQLLKRGRCANTPSDFAAFLAPLGAESGYATLESTTNSRAIARMIRDAATHSGINMIVDVLDARKLRIIAESVSKCDRRDAAVLNELSRANLKLPICYMPDDKVFALREHLRARSDLVRIRTSVKNRVHAVLHRRGVLTPLGGLFTQAGRTFLAQAKLDDAGSTIVQLYLRTIDQLNGLITESNDSLKQLTRRPRWAKPAALLQTMPGVGLITAMTILAELGDPKRFRRRAAVANYAGLVPVVRDSNDKRYRGGITKRGSTHLRAVLIEAAWIAIKRVPAYNHLFERVARRSNKLTAIVAVARRILEDAWTMLKREEAFRYTAMPSVAG